jgi:hypothetical protein
VANDPSSLLDVCACCLLCAGYVALHFAVHVASSIQILFRADRYRGVLLGRSRQLDSTKQSAVACASVLSPEPSAPSAVCRLTGLAPGLRFSAGTAAQRVDGGERADGARAKGLEAAAVAPGGVLLLVGPLGSQVATLELRYQDNRIEPIPLHDGWALYEVVPADYARGRRPEKLIARDANGQTLAAKGFPWG